MCTQKSLQQSSARRRPGLEQGAAARLAPLALCCPPSGHDSARLPASVSADSQQVPQGRHDGCRPSRCSVSGCPPLTVLHFRFLSLCGASRLGRPGAVNVVISHGRFRSLCTVFKRVRKQFCFLLGRFRTSEELFGDPERR